MNVRTAVQLFSSAVTAALKYMTDQVGHSCDLEFASVEPTIMFIETIHKWFSCMDVSNLQQHIHRNDENARQFGDVNDARLQWLENDLIGYTEELKIQSKKTHHALFSTKSNVQRIRHHPTEEEFRFVLTRKIFE
ncbi:hypothetical protein HPB50_013917 [Hyalomma asiaticum]|uniref:Uncharacterized protein n=1 Tax=Hyalomma asiaticum TaxID=266040 RepID=A0ACB7SEW0_HYAAI|nr:hypothetical protein HPB50_013917 [Hyalomma asiaticum]